MFQICADRHDELCHDGDCPACAALAQVAESDERCSAVLSERDELKKELRDANIELDQSKGEISRLESQIEHLQAKLDNK